MRTKSIYAKILQQKVFGAAALLSLTLLPVIVASKLPLIDYPNHLGRLQIYQSLKSGSVLTQFYEWHWSVIPNLALDLLILPFATINTVEQAANAIVIAALAVLYIGTMLLDRALNGKQWGMSLFAGLFIYNGAFQYGFVNYIIGLSAAIPAFALWISLRERSTSARLPIFLPVGFCIFILHLYAFGIFAICLIGYEVARILERMQEQWRKQEQWRWNAASLKPLLIASVIVGAPLVLMAFTSRTSQDVANLKWSTVWWKIEALASTMLFANPRIEIPLAILVIATIGWGLIARVITVNRNLYLVLAGVALLFLAMPRVLFGSNYADWRLPTAGSFLFIASLRWSQKATPLHRRILTTILAVCVAVRVAAILQTWLPAQNILHEYENAFQMIPPGSRLLVIEGTTGSTSADRIPPLSHLPVFVAAKHEIFVGLLFSTTYDGMGAPSVPVWISPAYARLYQCCTYPSLSKR
jgi:hypothetical protein